MKRIPLTGLLVGLAVAWCGAANGDDDKKDTKGSDKVQTVGKGGLKIDAKITDDDKKTEFKIDIGGKEFGLQMQSKAYSVKLEATKKYTMTLDTDDEDFDPFLVVQDSDGKTVVFDDDSGGKLSSKLTYSPKKAGTYKVHAAALKGTGDFTLKVTEAAGGKADPKNIFSVGKDGLKIKGTLDKENRKISYQVKMQAGKSYRIDLLSDVLDCYLFLHDPDGKKLAEDDDGGDDLNSRITHKAAADGTYTIVATSLGMVGSGNFVLEVREEE